MKSLVLVVLAGLVRGGWAGARSNVQSCSVSPSGIDNPETPAQTNSVIEINCNTDTEFDFCQFSHVEPMDVGSSYGSQNSDVGTHCNIAGGDTSSKTCPTDTRITMQAGSQTSCSIRINNPLPEDTGKWTVTVGEIGNTNVQSNYKTIELFTYNQSELVLQEKRTEDDISGNYEIWYNWDADDESWRGGTSGYDKVEIQCLAKYGRPVPTITWTINRDDRNELHSEKNIFTIRDNSDTSYDQSGYITDWISDMSFDVDNEFLEYLASTHGIDTNPENGEINFDLDCLVDQGSNGEYNSDRINTRIMLKRIYFSDTMKGTTIGMIVGLVLAGLLLIVVVMLLVFAKATERWCFADDEYGYNDPRDQKRRPNTQAQR